MVPDPGPAPAGGTISSVSSQQDSSEPPRARGDRASSIIALTALVCGGCAASPHSGGRAAADRAPVPRAEALDVGCNAPAWRLVWSDEFGGSPGSVVDDSKWGVDTGGGGWGNNELQAYTSRTSNVRQNGQGQLEIVARAESFGDNSYTSGRINTAGRLTQRYGRFEARIRLPFGNGIWPAFWSLGDDLGSVGWPACGELDIMEVVRDFCVNHGTAHGPGYSGDNPLTATYTLPSGSLADDFHIYAIEWEPNVVRWYVDDTLYEQRTPADLPPGTLWVYDHPFFLLLNLAVGGDFSGPPDASTSFPQTMTVDYVRVCAR